MHYYYLDKDDGYSKGPYTWDELKRLPLPPETYIYNQQFVEWRTLEAYHEKMAAEARAAVKRVQQERKPARQLADVSPPIPDIWRERKAEPYKPAPRPQPVSIPQQRSQPQPGLPSNSPKTVARSPFPPVAHQPYEYDDSPMGLSGTAIFILAAVLAILFVLFFILM